MLAIILVLLFARADDAIEAMKRQDFSAAIALLERALDDNPGADPVRYQMLADCHLALNHPDRAAAAFERGLQVHPHSALLAKAFGQFLSSKNPLDPRAGQLLSQAAAGSPADPEAHYFYGQWALFNHQEELTIAELTKALSLSGANDRARMQNYTLIAIAEDSLARPDRVRTAFLKALDANRRLGSFEPNAAYEYVKFLEKEQREQEAQKVVMEILRHAPSFGPAHLSQAKLLAAQKRLDEALAVGELALARAGGDLAQQRAARSFLAKTYFAAGKIEDAERHQKWLEAH